MLFLFTLFFFYPEFRAQIPPERKLSSLINRKKNISTEFFDTLTHPSVSHHSKHSPCSHAPSVQVLYSACLEAQHPRLSNRYVSVSHFSAKLLPITFTYTSTLPRALLPRPRYSFALRLCAIPAHYATNEASRWGNG